MAIKLSLWFILAREMPSTMRIFFGRRAHSASRRSGGAAGDRQRSGPNCGLGRRLVRELRRQSKMPCVATKSTAFRCQYDPLSYSRNFDRNGFGAALDDDEDGSSDHFYYTFSSRFVAGSSSCSRRVPCSGIVAAAAAAAATTSSR